jgi:hypothetical protein
MLASLVGFFGWMMFGTTMMKNADIEIPQLPDRPAYVPDSAKFCQIGQTWIDVQEDPIGVKQYYYLTIYDPDTAAVTRRAEFTDSPEILSEGRFELEYGTPSVRQLRRMIYVYDGSEIYLKDGRVLYQDYN